MSYPLRNNYNRAYQNPHYAGNVRYLQNGRRPSNLRIIKRPKRKENPIVVFFKLAVIFAFLSFVGYFVMPYIYETHISPMLLNRINNKTLAFNAKKYYAPTLKYLHNSNFMGENMLSASRSSAKIMTPLTSAENNYALEASLYKLAKKYPNIQPAIFVYDYVSGSTVDINANVAYPSASIIKIPILFELFRISESLEKQGDEPINMDDTMLYDAIHQTSGSGDMQYASLNQEYTIKHLANLMITNSDNSATNMLLDKIGGMSRMNSSLRMWGFSKTQMSSWLPDLEGTNTITAYDVSVMLYNLDNPNFLNQKSREYIKDFMSNVRNTSLLKAGLPKDALLLHKTGDIGTMLGDAGIVYCTNGRKYIVSILVKRPFNDYGARTFIQEASNIIYKAITENVYY